MSLPEVMGFMPYPDDHSVGLKPNLASLSE